LKLCLEAVDLGHDWLKALDGALVLGADDFFDDPVKHEREMGAKVAAKGGVTVDGMGVLARRDSLRARFEFLVPGFRGQSPELET
jgi:pyrroline-5-carboxylate reductase